MHVLDRTIYASLTIGSGESAALARLGREGSGLHPREGQ